MYSAHSPTSSLSGHTGHLDLGSTLRTLNHSPRTYPTNRSIGSASAYNSTFNHEKSTDYLKMKYLATFFVCTTSIALLSASLVTHKWLVSKPIRQLKQQANLTALAWLSANDDTSGDDLQPSARSKQARLIRPHSSHKQVANQLAPEAHATHPSTDAALQQPPSPSIFIGNKFQGEIYFGLFNGVKLLNHGLGNRVSQISVPQQFFGLVNKDNQQQRHTYGLVRFSAWLITLLSVVIAAVFALIGSIFAIVNFVMTPRATLSGPVGLVIWNVTACFACSSALFTWLVEFHLRLKANVLTREEVQNGWTSENRSQFGYSYYLVVIAFVLHLANIFIVSLVQFETWSSQKEAIRHFQSSRNSPAYEGVIMLY